MTHRAFLHSTRECLKILMEHSKKHMDSPGITDRQFREAQEAYHQITHAYGVIAEFEGKGGDHDGW